MENVANVCAFIMLCVVSHALDLKLDLYLHGDMATVHIDQLGMKGNVLEINFAGYDSKPHNTNVMLYSRTKKNNTFISINNNYTGRITDIKMSSNSLSFRLRNVTFKDSGNYTVFDGSVENGKTSILVARHRFTGQDNEPMVLPFLYNKLNISTIQIEMLISSIKFQVLTFDMKKEKCTSFGDSYVDRIQNCVLSGNHFYFTLQEVSWLDKGTYAALDDKGFILDTIMVDYKESFPSNIVDDLPSKQDIEPTGSSYTLQRPQSSENCKSDIGMNGVFDQMFNIELERLSIERERLKAELERMKVEKQRLIIETERLGLEKERTEILKSNSND